MILYLAGNFPVMGDIEKEKELYQLLGKRYNRLGSFYFEQTKVLIKTRHLIKGEENASK